MSTDTYTATPVSTGPVTLPRVNLLPPEIGERKAMRRLQLGLAGAGVASVAAVAALYVSASGAVSQQQQALTAEQQRAATVQTEIGKYQNVADTYSRRDAARANLTNAMGGEVQWSRILTDMSLTVPQNVWLTNFQVTQNVGVPGQQSAAVVSANGATSDGIGTVTASGYGFTYNDVAAWLESLAKEKGYSEPYFTSAQRNKVNSVTAVQFSSTVTVTKDAQSGRYTKTSGS